VILFNALSNVSWRRGVNIEEPMPPVSSSL